MTFNHDSKPTRDPRYQSFIYPGGTVIVILVNDLVLVKRHVLSGYDATLWTLIDGVRSLADIHDVIKSTLSRDDLNIAIDRFKADGLLME